MFPGDQRMLILNAPYVYQQLLGDISFDKNPLGENQYDFVQIFAEKQVELEQLLKSVSPSAKFDCVFWACYPKGTGTIKSDIKRDTMWTAMDGIGLRCVTQVSIDETWSAMRGRPAEKVGK